VDAVAFSADGKLVATGSEDKTARVFAATTGRELLRLAHQASVDAVAFSADGKLLATGSRDNTARVFEAATGREVSRLAHQDFVHAVAFSPDSKLFVTQTGNWLHLYQREGDRWRPVANRDLPVIWPNTARFLLPEARCPRCVEVVRDVPENFLKLDRINFDEDAVPRIEGDPGRWLEEWSGKLGLRFDSRGRIVPLQSGSPK
jgi:dipeptidyl aminopeptidase/acylaminoacyl peptidase